MAAFDFPNPPTPGQEVTNDATGITYKYDETTQSWSVVASDITEAYATAAELEAETSARTGADNALSGRIGAVENDYTTTEEYNNLRSDVSTAKQKANSALTLAEANEKRIEVLEQQIQNLTEIIPPPDIGEATIVSSADIDGGNAAAGQDEAFSMTCTTDGSAQTDLVYQWSITRGQARFSGSNSEQSVVALCLDPAPATVEFKCTVTHPRGGTPAVATKLVLVADGA